MTSPDSDKAKAFSEARRALVSGGAFIFSVWDRIGGNEFADTVTIAVESLFPKHPLQIERVNGGTDRQELK